MSNGPASPAPTPSSRPEQGYRQRLNNWLQSRGIETSTLTREGQQREFEGRTIWTVVYRCPSFHFSPRSLGSYP